MGIDTAVAAVVLVVRMYHAFGAGWTDGQTAQSVAQDILERADIAVRWIDCRARPDAPSDVPARCEQTLEGNELVLRVLASGPGVRGVAVPMGYSFVHNVNASAGGAPWPVLATVYADRVNRAARAASVDAAVVLGRAMAHEIGHLLLNHPRHARHGLMRALWTTAQFRRNRDEEWAFEAGDARAMRDGLARRAAPQIAGLALPRPKRS